MGQGSCFFLSFLGALTLLFSSVAYGGNWVYFDACGVEIKNGNLPEPEKFAYAPAPQVKGYLVNTKAVMLMAELRRYRGIRCTVLVGPGGNTVHVVGTLKEVRRKIENGE